MKRKAAIIQMFTTGEDLPLFSGTPQEQAQQKCFDGFQLEIGSRKFQIKRNPDAGK